MDLTEVLGWGSLDIHALDKYTDIACKFGVYTNDIFDEIKSMGRDIEDINAWFYVAIDRSFFAIMEQLEENIKGYVRDDEEEEKVLEEIENMRDNFSPFINCLDSWYMNILDDIDLTQDVEDIFTDIVQKILAE